MAIKCCFYKWGKMKKLIWLALTVLVLQVFFGCASTLRVKENWIDDVDLQMAITVKSVHELTSKFGSPVFTEIHGDTVEYVYNCRPHLYITEKDGRVYKPTEKDKIAHWSNRREMIGLQAIGDKLVGIRHRDDYAGDKSDMAIKDDFLFPKIVAVVMGVATLVVLIILI